MSTSAIIRVKANEVETAIYKHCDGYMEYTGEIIFDILKRGQFNGADNFLPILMTELVLKSGMEYDTDDKIVRGVGGVYMTQYNFGFESFEYVYDIKFSNTLGIAITNVYRWGELIHTVANKFS